MISLSQYADTQIHKKRSDIALRRFYLKMTHLRIHFVKNTIGVFSPRYADTHTKWPFLYLCIHVFIFVPQIEGPFCRVWYMAPIWFTTICFVTSFSHSWESNVTHSLYIKKWAAGGHSGGVVVRILWLIVQFQCNFFDFSSCLMYELIQYTNSYIL